MLQEDSSSSSEDVDYVPSDLEALSEEDESGEEEKEVTGFHLSEKKQRKQRKAGILPRKRKGGIQLEPDGLGSECNSGESDDEGRKKLIEEVAEESKIKEVEKEKEKAEALWASFLSDVGPQSKGCSTVAGSSPSLSASVDVNGSKVIAESNSKKNSSKENVRTISVTKVYDYAGEEVRVTKDVDINSKEAKMHLKKTIADTGLPQKDSPSTNSILGKRPRVSGGLGSILNKIGKKEKLSTLEKSKLDWDTFRKEEGIEDELKLHNKGKSSYLERKAFLDRTDQRQFQIEKSIRLSSTSKR